MTHQEHTTENPRPRVLLLHNFLTPYRVPLFTELATRFNLDVWILGDVRKIREWEAEASLESFAWRELPHISLPAGSRDYRILVNHTLPRELAQQRADVLICAGWDTPASFYAARWARKRHIPYILWSGSTFGEPNWRRTLARKPVRWLVNSADAWLAYGSRAKAYLESLGARTERIFCAYNTVETGRFAEESQKARPQRDRTREAFGIRSCFMILYCGQLIDRKGLGDLIPAFARLIHDGVDAALLVVGTGPREQAFKALAEREGVAGRVVFAGFVSRDQLPQVYACADLMALPSREEVWGLVINEALACGVPVLTTDNVGAAPDLIRHTENGYVVQSASVDGLAEALRLHFSQDTDREAMATAAQESIAPFSIAAAADAFETAVNAVLQDTQNQH